MSVHVFTRAEHACIHKSRARVSIRLKGQISGNNIVAIVFLQGILEPDTVFIKL